MHIVPLKHVSSSASKMQHQRHSSERGDTSEAMPESTDFLSVQDAAKIVRDPIEDTQASQEIELVVWQRISGFVSKLC